MAAKRLPNKRLVRDDRLSSAARAAGFVMATPDDSNRTEPDGDAVAKPATALLAIESSGWKSASPQRALVAAPSRPASFHQAFLHWVASLTGRAPA